MQSQIILASASKIRASMLVNAGVNFTTQVARIDEDAIKAALLAEKASPCDVADQLAEMKALRVSRKSPEAIVIGSDQVLSFDKQILSKPVDLAAAREQLLQLRGHKHVLYSAAVIVQNGQPIWRYVAKVRLFMNAFSEEYLDAYLARMGDEVLQTVGSYKLEGEGVRLFSKIEGDYFSILGMPLIETLGQLARMDAIEK